MNIYRDPEMVIAAWLDDGPAALPSETRQAIVVGLRTAPRRRPRLSWPSGLLPRFTRLPEIRLAPLAVALLVLAVGSSIAVGIYALRGTNVGPPPATADATASPSHADAPATANPTATPSDAEPPAPTRPPSTIATAVPSAVSWPGPVHADAATMPLVAMEGPGLCITGGYSWDDGPDAANAAADILVTNRQSRALPSRGAGFTLAAKPPRASDVDADEVLIQYGLVVDADRDGSPDYEVGVDNSVGDGEYRVWWTDLASGETTDYVGPSLGSPVYFVHPDEQVDEGSAPSVSLEFRDGHPLVAAIPNNYRYYAWSSYSEDGIAVAWDYAPDFGWLDAPCELVPVAGWPSTTQNVAGMYSWNGSRCAGSFRMCSISPMGGFMHNGYGSGDVDISLEVLAGPVEPPAGENPTYHTIAGRWALYRQIDRRHEEWIVDIDGTTMAIRLSTKLGTSQADLDEAHEMIETMFYEPLDVGLGFRLVFTMTTDDWDSG